MSPSDQALMVDMEYSTNPDPRRSPRTHSGAATPTQHPDLNDEVATLSTKLINAINYQTTLDDTLASTRHELEDSRQKVRELEEKVASQQEQLTGDVWVRRSSVEDERNQLLSRVAEEKRRRADVEKEKKKIEQELENLTTALFEEANKMVISAKEEAQKEHDAIQRKNDQLKAQLADTEGLLKSQQEQLMELKQVMEQMNTDRDDHSGTTPSSPGFSKFDARDDDTHTSDTVSQSAITEPSSPTYPTNLTHLLQPVLRTDLASYDDFLTLVKTSQRASSRVSSGSYNGLNPLLALSAGSAPSNASTSSLATAATLSSNVSPQTPNTPASAASSGSSSVPLPPLKETKFYKRALAEDVEPTLRLDIAPGLSWLARRSVLNAMTEGTLVVEPVPTSSPFAAISKPQFYPCSLCGENRKDAPHQRMHRFRTSEAESAQRYPLCKYCLSRVRSTCDFLGFLRIVKDGHWRADDADAERAAWEESVRLREQMFWSRIGGGVIPTSPAHALPGSLGEKSPRTSQEAQEPVSQTPRLRTPPLAAETTAETAVVVSSTAAGKTWLAEPEIDSQSRLKEPEDSATGIQSGLQHSTQSSGDQSLERSQDAVQRLSLTIPGAFDHE